MTSDVHSLTSFLTNAESVTALSGAGVSTPSGIPDYRDRDGEWKYAQPMQFGEFTGSRDARKRYWSRSYAGWQRFSKATPNPAHHALASMETSGIVTALITQNVDELHTRAGSRNVIDLHGRLSKVRCLDCSAISERAAFQTALRENNPHWHARATQIRADGDAELEASDDQPFKVPGCEACGGNVKPDVVMFGESVPKTRVESAMNAVESSGALLVLGSSLMVYSGFRFARRASEAGIPIAIVNQGRTRADDLAEVKIDADCSRILPAVAAALLTDAAS